MSVNKITVVVPVYNVGNYISGAVSSLAGQSNRNFDLILVDDGSTDLSIKIALRLLDEYGLEYLLIRQNNLGQGAARNAGFFACKTEWILFLDSDDALQLYAIDKLYRIINDEKNKDVEAVFSDYQAIRDNDVQKPSFDYEDIYVMPRREIVRSFLVRDKNYLVPGTLYRKDFLLKYGITHKALRWSEDLLFQFEVMDKIQNGLYCKSAMYNYLTRSGSVMSTADTFEMSNTYEEFKAFLNHTTDPLLKKYFLSRWVLGCLHIVSRKKDPACWADMWIALDGKKHMSILSDFPDLKVRILAGIGSISSKLLYSVLCH